MLWNIFEQCTELPLPLKILSTQMQKLTNPVPVSLTRTCLTMIKSCCVLRKDDYTLWPSRSYYSNGLTVHLIYYLRISVSLHSESNVIYDYRIIEFPSEFLQKIFLW